MKPEVRVRFGFRHIHRLLPFAGVFVIYMSEKDYETGVALTAQLRAILPDNLRGRLVFERS